MTADSRRKMAFIHDGRLAVVGWLTVVGRQLALSQVEVSSVGS